MNFQGINNIEERILQDKETTETIHVEDCEESIIEIGSNGKFQKVSFLLLTICYTCTSAYIANSFIFLLKDPEIECFIDDKWQACKRIDACKGDYEYRINFIDKNNYSWTNDYELKCDDNYQISLFITLFLAGNLVSAIFASWISDYVGRVKILKVSMALRAIIILCPLIFPNEVIVLLSLILLGLLHNFHSNVSYILMSEYVSRFEKDRYLTLMMVCESFSGIISCFYFYMYQNWRIFFLLNLFYGLIFSVFSYHIIESPRYLVAKNKYDDARNVLKLISKINIGKEVIIKFEKEVNNDSNKNGSIYLEKPSKIITTIPSTLLCKSTKFKKYIIILPILVFSIAISFIAIGFEKLYLITDIYISSCILFSSEVIIYFISLVMMVYFGKKYSMMICFLISSISNIIFYFNLKDSQLTIYMLIVLSKFGANAAMNIGAIYTNEYFPTDLRGRAIAICLFAGRFGEFLAPIINSFNEKILFISSVFSLISCLLIIPLENTSSNTYLLDQYIDVEE